MSPMRDLPTSRLRRIVVLGAASGLLLLAGLASADIYECRLPDGSTLHCNDDACPKRARCRVVVRTPKPPQEKDRGSGGAPGASRKRRAGYIPPPGLPEPSGDLPPSDVTAIVAQAAERYNLPKSFLLGVIHVESRFKVRALSPVGAMGLMQLMPATAREVGVLDPWDPFQNIMGGARYLRKLADRFDGDYVRVLSGYHAGGAAVARKGGIPYLDTDTYVRRVLDAYYAFEDGEMEPPSGGGSGDGGEE